MWVSFECRQKKRVNNCIFHCFRQLYRSVGTLDASFCWEYLTASDVSLHLNLTPAHAANHTWAPPTPTGLRHQRKTCNSQMLMVPSSSYSANSICLSLPFTPLAVHRQKKREWIKLGRSNFGRRDFPPSLCVCAGSVKTSPRWREDGGECQAGALTQ